jgi:hypothetical protein
MIIHNRRKRREYFAKQEALHTAAVYEARTAMRHGTASAEQQALVENEEMAGQLAEAREAEKSQAEKKVEGVLARGREWLFEGLKREEGVGDEVDAEDLAHTQRIEHEERMRLMAAGMGTALGEENEGMGGMGRESAVLRAVEERKAEVVENAERAGESGGERGRSGGMLDRLGMGLATSAESSGETPKQGGGWMAFMSRR